MKISLRQACRDDLSELATLFDAYRQFYQQPSQPEECRRFLELRIDRRDSVIFVAFFCDQPDAMGFAQLYPSFSSVRMQSIWWLNDLFVAPTARSCGVGRALLDAARGHSIATGSAGLMLETHDSNTLAHGLYERYGYRRLDPGSRFYWYATG